MEKHINGEMSKLSIHQLIKRIRLTDSLIDIDAISLYPSARWVEKSIYPGIETGYAFTKDMNDELVEKFNCGKFTQGSGVSRRNYYNPKHFVVKHLLAKKSKRIEVNRMKKDYIVDVLASADIQEIVKIGGEVVDIYEGVSYRKSFKISAFRDGIGKLFVLRQKEKDEGNDVMQLLVNIINEYFKRWTNTWRHRWKIFS